jgi:hypothetical protein
LLRLFAVMAGWANESMLLHRVQLPGPLSGWDVTEAWRFGEEAKVAGVAAKAAGMDAEAGLMEAGAVDPSASSTPHQFTSPMPPPSSPSGKP